MTYHLTIRRTAFLVDRVDTTSTAPPPRSFTMPSLSLPRLFVWSLQDMPMFDGRTTPGLVEVASLRLKWLATSGPSTVPGQGSRISQRVSAVGYYDALGSGGAPTELQAIARAAGGNLAIITARVHQDSSTSKFGFRNTRSVILPLGPHGAEANGLRAEPARQKKGPRWAAASKAVAVMDKAAACEPQPPGREMLSGVPHPNLPLVARLRRDGEDQGGGDGWQLEVYSWVNGGSHLQCIPRKPQGAGAGQAGHTADVETEQGGGKDEQRDDAERAGEGREKGGAGMAPLFNELAQKVKSGDEPSFVPYILPSLVLRGPASQGVGEGAGSTGRTGAGERIAHAMWLADWIGAEALPPALAVVDSDSCLHVFELDDGAAAAESADDFFDVAAGLPPTAKNRTGSDRSLPARRSWSHGTTGTPSTAPTMPLSHSVQNLRGPVDGQQSSLPSSPERPSRRARPDVSERLVVEEPDSPQEKTVILPLDMKYGLGLTLAFHDDRVSGGALRVAIPFSAIPGVGACDISRAPLS